MGSKGWDNQDPQKTKERYFYNPEFFFEIWPEFKIIQIKITNFSKKLILVIQINPANFWRLV